MITQTLAEIRAEWTRTDGSINDDISRLLLALEVTVKYITEMRDHPVSEKGFLAQVETNDCNFILSEIQKILTEQKA